MPVLPGSASSGSKDPQFLLTQLAYSAQAQAMPLVLPSRAEIMMPGEAKEEEINKVELSITSIAD